MEHSVPGVIPATEITVIDEGWFVTLAQRKRELLRGFGYPSKPMIAVFGSAMTPRDSRDWKRAEAIGTELAKQGAIVINGGYGGSMEAASLGANICGGKVVGVTCADLPEKEANQWITDEWACDRWDQRLIGMIWLADGYILLPGSSGTLVELSMVIETQLKGFLPIRPLICFGSFWKQVVKRIAGAEKVIQFAGTARLAARLAVGAGAPLKVRRRLPKRKGV